MFHILIYISAEDRLTISDGYTIFLAVVGIDCLVRAIGSFYFFEIVHIIERNRSKIYRNIMHEIFVLIAAISIFYTLKLTYLKEYRFQVGCRGCVAIYLYSVSVTCLSVDIAVLISTTQIMEEIFIVEIIDCGVIATIRRRVIDVIIIGRITHVLVSAAIEYILTLIFCITLCRIAHTHTRNLLGHRDHGVDISMKCSCLFTTLSQHITSKISCHLLLFVIIRELDAKGTFKR